MATAVQPQSTTKLKLKPLSDRVVCQRDQADETTAGGIVLPDSAKEKVNRARVIAVGPGTLDNQGKRVPLTVRAGERVLLNKWGGDEFEVGGLTYTIVKESDILAVIDE